MCKTCIVSFLILPVHMYAKQQDRETVKASPVYKSIFYTSSPLIILSIPTQARTRKIHLSKQLTTLKKKGLWQQSFNASNTAVKTNWKKKGFTTMYFADTFSDFQKQFPPCDWWSVNVPTCDAHHIFPVRTPVHERNCVRILSVTFFVSISRTSSLMYSLSGHNPVCLAVNAHSEKIRM